MRTATFLAALCALSAGTVSAQSMNITKPKEAARKAVAATNAHTVAMTTVPGDSLNKAGRNSDTETRSTQSAGGATLVSESSAPVFERESFSYERAGRRDPFVSLMTTGDLRPLITDLKVTSIAYSTRGGSVAILRDLTTKEQYRVRVGDSLGRMRVSRINARAITFTIDEFGFSRQETLALKDPDKESSK